MTGLARKKAIGLGFAAVAAIGLTGCDENGEFLFAGEAAPGAAQSASAAGPVVERDVEAPDVFSATEAGLWDGRPSLGGVWVAHPDVTEPERVIIRNQTNGKFVVGALFRRERDIPGPRLQVSSDAATALSMLAGAPVELNVTALRREEVPQEAPAPAPVEADMVDAPADVETTPLDPIAAAGAALDDLGDETAAAPAPMPAPQPKPKASSLSKPFLQVGIFSVQANADRTAAQMRSAGMVPTIRRGETGGKPFWRVIVGPASTSAERRALLDKIKATGFTDAYPVSN